MHRRPFILAVLASAAFAGATRVAEVPAPRDGMGLIMLYRPRRAMGAAIQFQVNNASAPVGNLSNGSVIAFHAPAGQHVFTVATPSVGGSDSIAVDLRAGETVFVRADMRAGWAAGRGRFVRVGQDQGRTEISQI